MLGSSELLIVLAIVFLIFGAAKLPKLARSLGQAQKEFRHGLKEGAREDDEPESAPQNGALSASDREELEKLRKARAEREELDQLRNESPS